MSYRRVRLSAARKLLTAKPSCSASCPSPSRVCCTVWHRSGCRSPTPPNQHSTFPHVFGSTNASSSTTSYSSESTVHRGSCSSTRSDHRSMCYFVNVLDLLWIWVFPGSTILFIGCYLLTLGTSPSESVRVAADNSGPLASAIITWRNSLVFHSLDKVTSLFIHMYPPVVLTVIR